MQFPAQNVQLFATHIYAVNQPAPEALFLCDHHFQQTFYMTLYNICPLQSLVLWDSYFLPNILQAAQCFVQT
uniref:Uncharacterized protein n=1 Tax=Anguilla anguilla TaxID=7936 RepID=A0A0E9Q500_ANGAN